MIALPLQIGRRRILILVLEKENLVRLQMADPIDLDTAKYFVPSEGARYVELMIAFESDHEKIMELGKAEGLAGIVKYLERGRTVYDGEIHEPKKI